MNRQNVDAIDSMDNWRLSPEALPRLIPSSEWSRLGWEPFQNLVCEYLHAKFTDETELNVVASGSGVRDGGRDFEITFKNPYRNLHAFVECKHHRRHLGLEILGKYLVVIIANHADELFIVSSSPITRPARTQFTQAANSSRVRLSLIDGGFLDRELMAYPNLIARYFPNVIINNNASTLPPLYSLVDVRPFAETDSLPSTSPQRIKLYDDQFYVHLLLKNTTQDEINDIEVSFSDPDYCLTIADHPEFAAPHSFLAPMEDSSIVYCCRARIPQREINQVKIEVSYRLRCSQKQLTIGLPILDFSSLTSPPLVGQGLIELLTEKLPIIAGSIMSGAGRLLDIRGVSGVGKSRLLHEISGRLRDAGVVTHFYDAFRSRDSIFRRLIADLAALPLYKGSLKHATNQMADLLRARSCSTEYADDIGAFLTCDDVTWTKLYSITEVLKHFIRHPVRSKPLAIIIDNVQEISPTALQLILSLCEFIAENESRVFLVLASNTELIPQKAVTPISEFHDQLESFGHGTFRTRYDVEPLTKDDARLLIYGLLEGWALPESLMYSSAKNDAVVDMLIKKSGTRPLDLLMSVQWLEETGVIRRQGALAWFITDFKRFAESIHLVPRGSATLIRRRLKVIVDTAKIPLARSIRNTLCFLVAFRGRLPRSFAERNITITALSKLLEHSILRQDIESGTSFLVAYHDNIYRFLEAEPAWAINSKQAQQVLQWVGKQDDSIRKELAVTEFFNAVRARLSPLEVINIGGRALSHFSDRGSLDIHEIGDSLKNYLKRSILSDQERKLYLPIKIKYANSLVLQADVDDGLSEFEDLHHEISVEGLNDPEICELLYHGFTNACLHTAHYDRALRLLNERKEVLPCRPEELFRLYDRYGVTYTALGKVDEAQQWLGQALTIAQEHQQPDWESKAYYDIGYIHVHATFDSNRARKAFQQSVEVCSDLSVVPAWRRIEMYQAKALVALLERRIEAAVNAAHEGLWLSKRESLAYYDVKLLNLLGVCKLAAGLYEEARLAFSRSRSVAAMCFNERAFWRALANLGALTALEEGPAQAMDYLSLAEQNLRTRVRGGAFTREVPILANYIVICAQLGQEQRVRQLVSAWPDPRLTKLAHELARTAGGRISSLGLFRQRGLAFCAT